MAARTPRNLEDSQRGPGAGHAPGPHLVHRGPPLRLCSEASSVGVVDAAGLQLQVETVRHVMGCHVVLREHLVSGVTDAQRCTAADEPGNVVTPRSAALCAGLASARRDAGPHRRRANVTTAHGHPVLDRHGFAGPGALKVVVDHAAPQAQENGHLLNIGPARRCCIGVSEARASPLVRDCLIQTAQTALASSHSRWSCRRSPNVPCRTSWRGTSRRRRPAGDRRRGIRGG